MGDPFSITVGILAVLGATGKVGKFLKEVIELSKGPDILLALNNELVDLHMLVQGVHDVLLQHSSISDQGPNEGLVRSLAKVEAVISKFERLLAYDLSKMNRDGSQVKLDKSSWLRQKSRVHTLKDEIRECKDNLAVALANFTRYYIPRADPQTPHGDNAY